MLAEFASDLGKALDFELRHSLKPITPADEVKRIAGAGLWERYRWNGFETGMLVQILEPGERIEQVGFRAIKTTKRTILRRDEIFDRFRPISNTREHWFRQCTSESKIAEAETAERREAAELARPFSDFAGPHVRPR